MVPGSTLIYGSNFCSRTRRPRCSRSMPTEAQVSPLPSELTTPPVTKICLATLIPSIHEKRTKPTKVHFMAAKGEPQFLGRPHLRESAIDECVCGLPGL